uniref:ATP-dependent RNA helicase dhh1 n=1 Tax=Arundo donax TaxID=35708 RepID=A0A0A9D795_ARUDO
MRVLLLVVRPRRLLVLVLVVLLMRRRPAAAVVVEVPPAAVAHARRVPGARIHGREEDSDLLRNRIEDAGSKGNKQIGSRKRI